MDADKTRVLGDRAQALGKLKDTDGWAELRRTFEAQREKHTRRVAADLIAGQPLDQRWLDRLHGFFAGAKWILDNPERAEATLEKHLQAIERNG